MRRRNRIDTIQPVLVARMKALGADWLPWPGGTIDGMVSYQGRVFACECKSGKTAPLTKSQQQLVDRGWNVVILRSLEDVDRMLGIQVQP